MAKLAIETRFGNIDSYELPTETYNENKLGTTSLIRQFSGTEFKENFAGPIPVGVFRPINSGINISGIYPWAMRWSNTEDWVFLADGAAAAATRRIQMLKFNRSSGQFSFMGAMTITFPAGASGNKLIRAFRMDYQAYTTGTASVNGTTVTGTDTLWVTDRLSTGARIGFGSKVTAQITTWYDISAIGSNTEITLSSDAGIITNGDYVIEELRAVFGITNATTANGGLFLVKGLNPTHFTSGPNAIGAAGNYDNVQGSYWLKDASTETNIATIGFGLDDKINWQTQYLYVMDNITNHVIYKYNIRAELSVASGVTTDAFVFKTGSSGATSGTTSQANNGRLAIVNHGDLKGKKCFYFTTTTYVYATIDVDEITNGQTTFRPYLMAEYPPGGANTFAATATINSIDYSETLDRFILSTSNKQYIAKFNQDSGYYDRIFTSNNTQLNQSTADKDLTPYPVSTLAYFSCWTVGGMLYMAGIGTTAVTNIVYAVPIGADWEYATKSNQRLILPKMSTQDALSYSNIYVNSLGILGGDYGSITNLGMNPDAYKVFYRISGISDNSGSWTPVDSFNLSNVPPCGDIQFSIVFKTISSTCIPSQILGVSLVYEDGSTDYHYQPSAGLSSVAMVKFAWRHSVPFNGTVPRLKITLYNAETANILIQDDSESQIGIWEKSTNLGGSWGAYDSNDKTNEDTYIRFSPIYLEDNVKVRALLSLY